MALKGHYDSMSRFAELILNLKICVAVNEKSFQVYKFQFDKLWGVQDFWIINFYIIMFLRWQLDSLKPKESLVIRQRYGLDGKGDRTLGEIAGNLNISREMVRKHEVKALMKLKHPTRVDYVRRYIF